MLITHNDQVPIFVGANSAIKALVVLGDALVPRVMIPVGGLYAHNSRRTNFHHEPHTPGGTGEVGSVRHFRCSYQT